MVKFLLCFCILVVTVSGKAQNNNFYFSEAVAMYLPKYVSKAQKAYRMEDVERANFLFDSLVNHCLKGSYLDNFKVRDLHKKEVRLNAFKKPIYLVTKASWLIPSDGEIPALNKLVSHHHDQIDFVIIFWDDHTTTKELAKKYHKEIKILYADEAGNQSNYIIRNMKHSLGFPTSFLLNDQKKIVDIRRNASHPYGLNFQRSYDLNFEAFSISLLLINSSSEVSALIEE